MAQMLEITTTGLYREQTLTDEDIRSLES